MKREVSTDPGPDQTLKRIKIKPLNLNHDPFRNLFDVDQLIYQHFSGKDVIVASLVSTNWYESIGNSSISMKKITLNLTAHSSQRPSVLEIKGLLQSKRKYAYIIFSSPWVRSIKNRIKILTRFASSIVGLIIFQMSQFRDLLPPLNSQTFPKLESLKFYEIVSFKLLQR